MHVNVGVAVSKPICPRDNLEIEEIYVSNRKIQVDQRNFFFLKYRKKSI